MTTAYRDLELDSTGDLVFENGDFALVQGEDAIGQECRIALGLWLGEFPFNTNAGTDWANIYNVKEITDGEIANEVRRVLLAVAGVQSVDSVTVTRDTATRAASLDIEVRADTGAVLTIPTVDLGVGV